MIPTANRIASLHTSVFTGLLEEKKAWETKHGKPVIDFTLGSPNIPPAKNVMDALCQAASLPQNYRYAVNPLPALIEAIQNWYQTRYQVSLADDEICLLQGSQEALINLPLLYCNEHDGILLPDPYYPAYKDAAALAGADLIYMPLLEENGWMPDLDAISEEERRKARLMIINYPNNPTGACADEAFLKKLIAFARDNDILIVYDSAYCDLVFEGEQARSFLALDGAKEVAVELNSFSKSYGMAGARMGIMAGNREVIAAYRSLKSNMDYGIFLPVQYAGITALETGEPIVEKTRAEYIRRRKLLQESFDKAGWPVILPPATMFVWMPVPKGWKNSLDFSRDLLSATGVMVTPGSAFGAEGEGYVRLALVVSEADILEAARRIAPFFAKHHN